MIISVGTTIYAVYEDFSHFLDPSYFSPATLLIVVGIFVFIIAFLGCCGALRESTCMVLVVSIAFYCFCVALRKIRKVMFFALVVNFDIVSMYYILSSLRQFHHSFIHLSINSFIICLPFNLMFKK